MDAKEIGENKVYRLRGSQSGAASEQYTPWKLLSSIHYDQVTVRLKKLAGHTGSGPACLSETFSASGCSAEAPRDGM
jgi:hypothetical protein